METKDFSHFKYYVKRLKEMGFRDVGTNDVDACPDIRLQRQIDEHEYYVNFSDYQDRYPQMSLSYFHCQEFHARVRYYYKIGFDADFEENIKTCYS